MVLYFVCYIFLAIRKIGKMPDVGKWYKFTWNGTQHMGQMLEITDDTFRIHAQYPDETILSLPRPVKLSVMTQKEIDLVREEELEVESGSASRDESAEAPSSPERPDPTSAVVVNPYEGAEALEFAKSHPEDEPSFNPDTVAKVAIVGLFVAICFSFN